MADETENHSIRLLQELRGEMRRQGERIEAIATELHEMRADLTNRIDGNTILLNIMAGLASNHEDRIGKLERGRP